jgi:uncharacterized protein YceH (UPF0502 family)
MVQLNEVEARVLGALVEKEITTPVMQLSEADVRTALFALDQLALVRTLADGRVSKFEHRFRDGLGTPLRRDEVAVLCLLLLRGPQTSAELRARSERLHTFEDNTAALATLDRLAQRPDALVVLLARQPGAREARWMHLLCGPVSEAVAASAGPRLKDETWGTQSRGAAAVNEELVQRVEALEEMVFSLEQRLFALEEAGEAKASE